MGIFKVDGDRPYEVQTFNEVEIFKTDALAWEWLKAHPKLSIVITAKKFLKENSPKEYKAIWENTLPTDHPTNQDIQTIILEYIKKDKEINPKGKITNTTLGLVLLRKLGEKTTKTPNSKNKLWNAQEHANRQCQVLRKSGKISYSQKTGWNHTNKKTKDDSNLPK